MNAFLLSLVTKDAALPGGRLRNQSAAATLIRGRIDESAMSAAFVISTPSQDRQGEVVIPKGCLTTLSTYRANPVVHLNHRTQEHPVAVSKDYHGAPGVDVFEDRIEAVAHFHGVTELSQQTWELTVLGVYVGASIGFRPILAERVPVEEAEGYERKGYRLVFRRWEMVEWSVTGVPCNQDAVIAHDYRDLVTRTLSRGLDGGRAVLPELRADLSRFALVRKAWPTLAAKDSYFSDCDRDEEGHCKPGSGGGGNGGGKKPSRNGGKPRKPAEALSDHGIEGDRAVSSEAEGKLTEAAQEKAKGLLGKISALPAKLVPAKVKKVAAAVGKWAKDKLAQRYGERGAALILKAAALSAPVPVPGSQPATIVLSLVIAEAVLAYRKVTGKGAPEDADLTGDELAEAVEGLMAELAEEIERRLSGDDDEGGDDKALAVSRPWWSAAKDSYFSECDRDDEGHCLPSGESGGEGGGDDSGGRDESSGEQAEDDGEGVSDATQQARDREDEEIDSRREAEDEATADRRQEEEERIEKARDREDREIEKAREKEEQQTEKAREKEDRQTERAREKEDEKTAARREKEDEKTFARRDREDEKIQAAREKEDAAVGKAREKEDADRAKEGERIEKAREKEDAATEKEREEEDAQTQAARDEEDAEVRSRREREDAGEWADEQTERAREEEDAEIESTREREEQQTLDRREKEDAERDARREKEDAEREREDTEIEEAREREDAEVRAAREKEDLELEEARQEEDEKTQNARDEEDDADVERRNDEDEETEARREAEDDAEAERRGKEDAEREARRKDEDREGWERDNAEDQATQRARDKEDEEIQRRRDEEDAGEDEGKGGKALAVGRGWWSPGRVLT